MSTGSNRRRPATGGLARLAARLAVVLVLATPGQLAGQAPTIVPVGGRAQLDFGSVLPGQAPVTVLPWSLGDFRTRRAPRFEIVGTPSATVTVTILTLPVLIENTSAAGLSLGAWTLEYSQSLTGSGATPLSATVGVGHAVTLNASGRGYVSLGATVAPSAAQSRGGYAFANGGSVRVQ